MSEVGRAAGRRIRGGRVGAAAAACAVCCAAPVAGVLGLGLTGAAATVFALAFAGVVLAVVVAGVTLATVLVRRRHRAGAPRGPVPIELGTRPDPP